MNLPKSIRTLCCSSLLAGMAISIGGTVYTAVGGIAGAVLFSFGLITVVNFKWKLLTGTAGFVDQWKEFLELAVILIFNVLGCWITARAVAFGRPELIEAAQNVIEARLSHSIMECGVLAIGCGFIMTVAVLFARRGRWLPLLFGVPVFILCGFLHSIADAFYISLANAFDGEITARWAAVVAGNIIGCNLVKIVNWRFDCDAYPAE